MEADTVSYYKLQCHGAVTVQADIYRTLVLQDKRVDFLETCNQTHTSTKRLSLILRQHNTTLHPRTPWILQKVSKDLKLFHQPNTVFKELMLNQTPMTNSKLSGHVI